MGDRRRIYVFDADWGEEERWVKVWVWPRRFYSDGVID